MAKIIPAATFDCVGVRRDGDLIFLRKLLPACNYRFRDGQMPPESKVIAAARSKLSDDDYRQRAIQGVGGAWSAREDLDPQVADRFCAQLCYVRLDATKEW